MCSMMIIAAVFVVVAVVIGIYVAKVKTRKDIRMSGGFDFADFKDRELSKRGVHDRTEWWK